MRRVSLTILASLSILAACGYAQNITGSMSGRVVDQQGSVVANASVTASEKDKRVNTVTKTNDSGELTLAGLLPGNYTVAVVAAGFKKLERLNIPLDAVAPLTPRVRTGGNSAGGTRLGGQSQNNIMMDGVSAMDTGNNGEMLGMNIESIGEVKALMQGYQAEYGRSSGLQIATHGKSGAPQAKTVSNIYGYSLGGPVYIPKIINGNETSRSHILGPRKSEFGSPDPGGSGEEKA